MLEKLSIKNVALIDSAEINFSLGLNVLSGETGAGKSVIIDSLNFVLGAKADKSLIRSGEDECFVKAEFSLPNSDVFNDIFNELEIDKDDILIISRKFSLDGKNKLTINGNTASLSMVKKFTSLLLDVHGQSEHFSLLKNSNQLDMIDKFSGENVFTVKKELKDLFSKYNEVLSGLEDLGGDDSKRLVKLDILNYQIEEISNASLNETEEDELITLRKKLQNTEKITNALNSINQSFNGEFGIIDSISNCDKLLASISQLGNDYSSLYERISQIKLELTDISETAKDLLDGFDFGDQDIDKIENRLELIKNLKRKYGNSIKEILDFLSNAKIEKDKLENFNELSKQLLDEKKRLEEQIYNEYITLNNLRKKSAKLFEKNVLDELRELGMENASFIIQFNDFASIDDCKFTSYNGIDEIEFMFSANLGEPVKPLSQIISGGEISRFMLGIKAQTAKYNNINTFVFDEIDSGISGKTAKVVAKKFAKISKSTQIIAITHLPQISAMADNNLLIEKNVYGDKTLTKVSSLNHEEKINEIIRLTGGNLNSESAKTLAIELIKEADEYKKSL